MSVYQKVKKSAHPKKDVDIPGNNFFIKPSKNNNQASVPINVTPKKNI